MVVVVVAMEWRSRAGGEARVQRLQRLFALWVMGVAFRGETKWEVCVVPGSSPYPSHAMRSMTFSAAHFCQGVPSQTKEQQRPPAKDGKVSHTEAHITLPRVS